MGCKVSVAIVHPDKDVQEDQEPQTPDYETPTKNPIFFKRQDSVESLVSISSPDSP